MSLKISLTALRGSGFMVYVLPLPDELLEIDEIDELVLTSKKSKRVSRVFFLGYG